MMPERIGDSGHLATRRAHDFCSRWRGRPAGGRRTVPLPRFAIDTLQDRRSRPYLCEQTVIFPSAAGTLRDPNNFGKQCAMSWASPK
jgi:hypothetical protein